MNPIEKPLSYAGLAVTHLIFLLFARMISTDGVESQYGASIVPVEHENSLANSANENEFSTPKCRIRLFSQVEISKSYYHKKTLSCAALKF